MVSVAGDSSNTVVTEVGNGNGKPVTLLTAAADYDDGVLTAVISARCVACDLHTIALWPLESILCWRQFVVQ